MYLFLTQNREDREYILWEKWELPRAAGWKRVIDKVKSIGYSSKKDGDLSRSRPIEVFDHLFGMKIPYDIEQLCKHAASKTLDGIDGEP